MVCNNQRRQFLKVLSSCIATMTLPSLINGQTKNRKKPNFILIFADDLGYGDLSGFGYKQSTISTPNIDRMANEGIKLTNFYVPTPYCAPSRATILTGRYPFRNGMVFNLTPDKGVNDLGLPISEITIADALKPAGYKNYCIGKWHLGHKFEFLPRKQGFDEYYGLLYSNDMRPVQLVHNEEVIEYPVIQSELTKKYTQRAIDNIKECKQNNDPFFMYLAHTMPHKPLAASEDFYTPSTPDDLYADVIRELDWSVGQIMDTLKTLGMDENTFVILTSDNGPWYGGSTGGLRGMKARSWEGGLRVPFIAHWPGKIPAGIVNYSVTASIDILPTILNLANIHVPQDRKIDGKNIWNILTNTSTKSPHEAIFGILGNRIAVVRSGKWKLHVSEPGKHPPELVNDWVDPRRPDGVTIIAQYEQAQPAQYPGVIGGVEQKGLMLFDMENDPSEQVDLSKEFPEIVKRLKGYTDEISLEIPPVQEPRRYKTMRRLKGGRIDFYKDERYDDEL